LSKFKRKDIPKKRIRNNKPIVKKGGNGKKPNKIKGGNGNGKLTALRLRFIDEYLKDLNATQAVIRAGYSKKGADSKGSQLLGIIKVQEAVQKRRLALQKKVQIDQEGVIKRYLMLVDYNIKDFFNDDCTMKPISEIPKEALYAICGFEADKKIITTKDMKTIEETLIRKFKLPDKKGVLDSLAKHLGMFEKDNQLTVVKENNINVKVELPESVDRIGDVLGILLGSGLVKRRLVEHSKGKLSAAQEVIDA